MSKFSNGKYLFLCLLIILATITYIHYFNYWTDDDEGAFLYYSWRISEGDVTYKDFPSGHPPLAFYLIGMVFKLFGVSAFIAKLVTLVITVFCVVFVYLIGLELAGEWAGLIAGILFLFSPDVIYHSSLFYLELYYVLFILAGLLFTVKATRFKKKIFYFLAGMFYGFAIETKLVALLPIIGVNMFLIRSSFKKNGIKIFDLNKFLTEFFWLLAGMLLMISIISFYLMIQGTFNHSAPLNNLSEKIVFQNFLYYFSSNKYITILFLISLPIAIVSLIKNNKLSLLSFYLFSLLLFFIYPRTPMNPKFFLYIVPSVSILIGVAVCQFVKMIHKEKYKTRLFLFYLISVFFLFIVWENSELWTIQKSDGFLPSFKANDLKILNSLKNLSPVITFIDINTDEKSYILADHGYITFFSRRKNLPMTQDIHQSTVNLILLEEFKEKIKTFKPEIIIIVGKENNGFHLTTYQQIDELTEYILRDYSLVKEFSPEYQLYILK